MSTVMSLVYSCSQPVYLLPVVASPYICTPGSSNIQVTPYLQLPVHTGSRSPSRSATKTVGVIVSGGLEVPLFPNAAGHCSSPRSDRNPVRGRREARIHRGSALGDPYQHRHGRGEPKRSGGQASPEDLPRPLFDYTNAATTEGYHRAPSSRGGNRQAVRASQYRDIPSQPNSPQSSHGSPQQQQRYQNNDVTSHATPYFSPSPSNPSLASPSPSPVHVPSPRQPSPVEQEYIQTYVPFSTPNSTPTHEPQPLPPHHYRRPLPSPPQDLPSRVVCPQPHAVRMEKVNDEKNWGRSGSPAIPPTPSPPPPYIHRPPSQQPGLAPTKPKWLDDIDVDWVL